MQSTAQAKNAEKAEIGWRQGVSSNGTGEGETRVHCRARSGRAALALPVSSYYQRRAEVSVVRDVQDCQQGRPNGWLRSMPSVVVLLSAPCFVRLDHSLLPGAAAVPAAHH